MAYPRNAATPPIVTVGQVVQSSDGAIQTSGASVRVKTGTGAWAAGSGTLACDATSGAWTYAPTQGETDAESFQIAIYKASCIGATIGVVTSALLDRLTSTRAGYLDNLSGGAVALASGVNVVQIGGQTVTAAASITVGAYLGGTGAAALETTAQTILADTNELQTDWANGGRLDVILDARASQSSVDDVPTVAEFEARTIVSGNYALEATLTAIKGATFDTATDSLEALRNRGDSAWITATGFSTLDAAGVRSAVGLASANLDTQLADVPTVAEFEARTLLAAAYGTAANQATIIAYIDTEVAAIKAKTDNLPASPAASGDIPSATTIADAVLGRSVATVESTAGEHSLATIVLMVLQSNTVDNAGKITIYQTDGTTEYMQRPITTDPAADPITGVS